MSYSGGPMTEAMYYVLLALMRPNHGYQLMHAIGEVSRGRMQMGPGTLYGVLSRYMCDFQSLCAKLLRICAIFEIYVRMPKKLYYYVNLNPLFNEK